MDTFYIALLTLLAYSLVGTILFIVTKENEEVGIAFGLGIVGITLVGILKIVHRITNEFKHHIGKRSIFEEVSTGNKYKCKVKDANDIWFMGGYKMIKRYAVKSEWINIPDFSKEFIENSKKNCNNCKYSRECLVDDDPFFDKTKCKHNEFGEVLEFDKFESK